MFDKLAGRDWQTYGQWLRAHRLEVNLLHDSQLIIARIVIIETTVLVSTTPTLVTSPNKTQGKFQSGSVHAQQIQENTICNCRKNPLKEWKQ